jgi:IclR family mhp operon transcriptional activator
VASAMSGSDTVRSAARVLQVLEALSIQGTAELAALQQATDLPKSTIARLLQTLVDAGYVRHVSRRAGYTVTERVLRLSAGFAHSDAVVSLTQPLLNDFTAKYKWSAGMTTFHRGALRLRYSTFSRSPIAASIPGLDRRVPLLTSAHGQVYFAFCSAVERSLILKTLRKSPHLANQPARDQRGVNLMVQDVRRKGYSLRPATPRDPVMGLALPILYDGTAVATIGVRFFRSAVSPDEALSRYLAPLKAIADAVSVKLQRHSAIPAGGIPVKSR